MPCPHGHWSPADCKCCMGDAMRDVNSRLYNVQPDRAHGDKPEHIDFTVRLPEIGGADKTEIDHSGNVIGGQTFIGKKKLPW